MTQPEYDKAKQECLQEFCKRYRIEEPSEQNIESFNWVFDRAYALGKQEKDADTVIQGWVARDENKKLFIYRNKTAPERRISYWKKESCWIGDVLAEIDATLFPDLTWGSDPSPVEIIIKRKKNGNSCTDNRI